MSLVRTQQSYPAVLPALTLTFTALDLACYKSFDPLTIYSFLLQAKDPDHWGHNSGKYRPRTSIRQASCASLPLSGRFGKPAHCNRTYILPNILYRGQLSVVIHIRRKPSSPLPRCCLLASTWAQLRDRPAFRSRRSA
jgi:hypothetical protein